MKYLRVGFALILIGSLVNILYFKNYGAAVNGGSEEYTTSIYEINGYYLEMQKFISNEDIHSIAISQGGIPLKEMEKIKRKIINAGFEESEVEWKDQYYLVVDAKNRSPHDLIKIIRG